MADTPTRNRLLETASGPAADALKGALTRVELDQGQTLYERGEAITRLYFPETAIVSIVGVFRDGGMNEMATVGREGMTGVGVVMGGRSAINHTIVQMRGAAWMADREAVTEALAADEALRDLFLRYARAFMGQVMQTVACNSAHDTGARCARWLLMSHDRSDGDTFPLTQEFLAQMLAVHRPTVTIIARQLQTAGLIRYSRGSITITDRPGLEEASCECYHAIREQYARRLPYGFA
jgi:CRP-like cAMP-binding protein